ncbi:hypothetical protein GUJ93_ZPchr0011g27117 [Zizania palustris]|uniref:Major facilitator superfamily (MFS) profile domain-containing protein n=1 Tax=Zizania palustris TaxID=103762 RepID=A0A8J5WGQ8_ZIZPA|nr:hypothetical protein GUJ93_ZPchr0011g27117 [Zizania palustris]
MGEEAPPSPLPAARPVFYDGCPGCAMDRKKESNQGVPYKELLFVGITTVASYTRPSCGKGRTRYWVLCWISCVKYWMAIATRFLLGSLNGMLAPIKAYSIEVCRPEHQALGLSVVSTAWGIGLVVGPAIGGYFAQPAKQYPSIFSEKSIFGRYIYMSFCGVYKSYYFIKIQEQSSLTEKHLFFFGRFPYFLPCLCISLIALAVLISCIWLPETLHKHKNIEGEVEMVDDDSISSPGEDSHKHKSLYKNWPLMSSIAAYCVFTLHDTAYSEIFSLWAVSNRKYGGLSFSSKEVGQVLASAGAGLVVYQLFIYRFVHKYLGPVNSTRVASALSIPILAAYPFMTHLSGFRLGIALYLAAILKDVLSVLLVSKTPKLSLPSRGSDAILSSESD